MLELAGGRFSPEMNAWCGSSLGGMSGSSKKPKGDQTGEEGGEREMSLSTLGYLTRRAEQKERVRILYRRALRDTLNWAVQRPLFYQDASNLRERFEANKHVASYLRKRFEANKHLASYLRERFEANKHLTSYLRERFEANKHLEDLDTIDHLIADAEAQYLKWRHPDPYIIPWAPGGTKFTRNPPPPSAEDHFSLVQHRISQLRVQFEKVDNKLRDHLLNQLAERNRMCRESFAELEQEISGLRPLIESTYSDIMKYIFGTIAYASFVALAITLKYM